MKVNFNEPLRSYLSRKEGIDEGVARVLESGYFILGEEVEQFERQFAEYCGVHSAVGVASGTDALLVALRAAGVGDGDEVITVSNAGGYSSIACFQIGAVPVYIDVLADKLVMDVDQVSAAITEKTRAIVATHLFGNMVDMKPLQGIASQYGITLIEDCAQAHGAVQDGCRAGSFGSMGVFSFYPTKNLGAFGDGGAIVCSDDKTASIVRELRQYGWSGKYSVQRPYGFNSRLDPLQAAILAVKLPFLDKANARRREIARRYNSVILDFGLKSCHQIDESYVGHLYVVRHPLRDKLRDALSKMEIATDIHYPILDCHQPGFGGLNWHALSLSNSEKSYNEILSLPIYPELLDSEVDAVCSALGDAIKTISSPIVSKSG